MGRRLRRDAAENRARILDAAAGAFAERGPQVSMDDTARHAGVAPSLRRRFPSEVALVTELVSSFYDGLVGLTEETLLLPPEEGLERLL
jgi:AcrR family transcriptional regulator